ncbi:MAG: hypothetical protein EBQ77_00160 [Sphingobacteriia bacterium]|nr:hypothetical protein [Sphingobacteriia bacterium]
MLSASVLSDTIGYSVGGLTAATTQSAIYAIKFDNYNTVQTLVYANYATTVAMAYLPNSMLATPRAKLASVSSPYATFFVGGFVVTMQSTIFALNHSTELMVDVILHLNWGRSNAAGIFSSSAGYVCGGVHYNGIHTNKVERLDYGTTTLILVSQSLLPNTSLTVARIDCCGLSN